MKTKIIYISLLILSQSIISCSENKSEAQDTNQEETAVTTSLENLSEFESFFLPVEIDLEKKGHVSLLNLASNPKTERFQRTELDIIEGIESFQVKTYGEEKGLKEEQVYTYSANDGWTLQKQLADIRGMKEGEVIENKAFPRNEKDTVTMTYVIHPNDSLATEVSYTRWFEGYDSILIADQNYNAMRLGEVRVTEAKINNEKTGFVDSISLQIWYVKGLGLVQLNFEGIPTPLKIHKIISLEEWDSPATTVKEEEIN